MSPTEIGVVIPTWNSAKTLAVALLSLQQQQGIRVKIVVADSGSEDGTLEICGSAGVQAVYVPPGNMYRAINVGLRMLGTPWLAYLNSDDFLYGDSYTRLVTCGEASGADVIYGNSDFVDAHARFLYSLHAARPIALPWLFRAT